MATGKNATAAKSGDRRKALIELRDSLAEVIDNGSEFAKINGSFAYRQVLAELAEMDAAKAPPTPKGVADDLRARREAKSRRPTSDASANA